MALTHRLFGIRSCNEVITGKRGAAVPRVRHQALHRAVRGRRSAREEQYGARCATRGCCSKGATTSSSSTLRERMVEAAGGERFEEAAQLRDAMRTVQTLRDRQQKMATRRARRSRRVRPEGRAGRRRRSRCSRCAAAASSSASSSSPRPATAAMASEARRAAGGAAAVLRDARAAAGDPPAGRRRGRARRWRSWLSERAGRRVRLVVPQRGDKTRRCVELAHAQRRARLSDALQREHGGAIRRARDAARRCWACRRCRAASSASTSRRSRAARPSRRWWCAKTAG